MFLSGGLVPITTASRSPNLFREKNRLGQRGTKDEAWSGPVFFLLAAEVWMPGRQSVILSRSDPNLIWSTVNGEPVLCHVFLLSLSKTPAAWMRRVKISLNRLKQDGPPLEATHPRIHANPKPHPCPRPAKCRTDQAVDAWHAPGHRGGSNRGKPKSSASQRAIYQESYFPQRGCDDDRRLHS